MSRLDRTGQAGRQVISSMVCMYVYTASEVKFSVSEFLKTYCLFGRLILSCLVLSCSILYPTESALL